MKLISWMSCLINSQTLKMISLVESFLCQDKQGTPDEGWRIKRLKWCVTTNNNKDEDNSSKNHTQNKNYFCYPTYKAVTNMPWLIRSSKFHRLCFLWGEITLFVFSFFRISFSCNINLLVVVCTAKNYNHYIYTENKRKVNYFYSDL